jgi:hypothetical protein
VIPLHSGSKLNTLLAPVFSLTIHIDQDAVCHRVFQQLKQEGFNSGITFETVGPAADTHEKLELYFDTLAPWLYEIEKQTS